MEISRVRFEKKLRNRTLAENGGQRCRKMCIATYTVADIPLELRRKTPIGSMKLLVSHALI